MHEMEEPGVIARDGELAIRFVTIGDGPQLTRWWNSGSVMAHAGFPDGLGISAEAVTELIENDSDENRHCILEYAKTPIGEMHYRTTKPGTAAIGIKICEPPRQGHGYGTRFMNMLLKHLFIDRPYTTLVLDTKRSNKGAQRFYEHKLGFTVTGERDDAIEYAMTIESYRNQAASKHVV